MPDTKKFTILIVDDIRTNIVLLAELLKHDYNIKVANNGFDALKIASETPKPDLIFLDIMMPGMDGYEVCTQLKNNDETKGIPVIFISAMSDEKDEEYGFQVGAIDYITKPIVPALVKARAKIHLERKNALTQLEVLLQDSIQAYTKLKETQEKLIQAEQKNAILAMAVTANHEMNQPLMVISSALDLLKIKINNPEYNSYFDKITHSVEKIESLLDQFKNIKDIHFTQYLDDVNMLDLNK